MPKIAKPKVRYIDPPGAPPAQGLYSHAARVPAGDLYFIAGQVAVDERGNVVGKHDFEAVARADAGAR